MRMEESNPAKKVFCVKPRGNGDRRGRPKLRWCDKLEEDVAWVMCRHWRIYTQSRDYWRKVMEEVKSEPAV
jgi:hypothetical protein